MMHNSKVIEEMLDTIEDGTKARHETVPFQVQRRESICSISE